MRNYSLPLFNSSIRQSYRDGASGNLFTQPFLIASLKNSEERGGGGWGGERENLDLIAVQKLKVNNLKAEYKHNAHVF